MCHIVVDCDFVSWAEDVMDNGVCEFVCLLLNGIVASSVPHGSTLPVASIT